jgi:hypothetical protein
MAVKVCVCVCVNTTIVIKLELEQKVMYYLKSIITAQKIHISLHGFLWKNYL